MNIKKVENLDENAIIKWRLTNVCNYKCSYCILNEFTYGQLNTVKAEENKLKRATKEIKRIAQDLRERTNKPIKVDMVGGEVTVLEYLPEIMEDLYEVVDRINITTNFYRPYEYFEELYNLAENKGKTLTLTASYHHENTTLKDYIDKAIKVQKLFGDKFKCETVKTAEYNKEDFTNACKENNLRFMTELSLTDDSKADKYESNKPKDRYKITYDDGTVKYYATRNEFLTTHADFGKMAIKTEGMKCSRDYSYVYIESDEAQICGPERRMVPLRIYNLVNEKYKCQRPGCSLCGAIDVERE